MLEDHQESGVIVSHVINQHSTMRTSDNLYRSSLIKHAGSIIIQYEYC